MMLIVAVKDAKKASAILQAQGSPVQTVCMGEGTATSEIMDYLGLSATDKAILLCPVFKSRVPALFEALGSELRLSKPNRGVALTFPVSGASAYVAKLLQPDLQQKLREHLERDEKQMLSEAGYSLLIVTINQGFSEEVMEVARAAGAGGGTVVHARRIGSDEPIKKWGIHVQPEKEMIYILVGRDKKLPVMKAIGENCGLLSEAQGIVMSIPVDAVAGLDSPA